MTREKGGQPNMELTKLSDPVQAALQKAAARKMRCAKPDPPEETPGSIKTVPADDTALAKTKDALGEVVDNPPKRLKRTAEVSEDDFRRIDSQATVVLGEDPGTPYYETVPDKVAPQPKYTAAKSKVSNQSGGGAVQPKEKKERKEKKKEKKEKKKALKEGNEDMAEKDKNQERKKKDGVAVSDDEDDGSFEPRKLNFDDIDSDDPEDLKAIEDDIQDDPAYADTLVQEPLSCEEIRRQVADEYEKIQKREALAKQKDAYLQEEVRKHEQKQKEAKERKMRQNMQMEKELQEQEAADKKIAEKFAKEREAKEAAEKLAKEREAKEAAEKLAKEGEAKEAAEKLAKKRKAKEAAEKVIKEREAMAKKREAKEAAEKLAKEREAKEAAEKLAKEREAKEAAEKLAKEREAKEAAEKLAKEREAKEAAEKLAKEGEAKQAAEKLAKEREAKEAAEKLAKEREAKEAAEKLAKEGEAKEAAEKLAKEGEAKEAAEKLAKEQETKDKDVATKENKRPVATPQVAEALPTLTKGSGSFEVVADILNRQNSLTSPGPTPASDTPPPPTPTVDGSVDTSSKKKLRTPAQLAIHAKKMSFYRSLDSSRSPPEVRSMAANARGCSNKSDMLQVLWEQWIQADGEWDKSQLVVQARSSVSGSKTGARRWMLRQDIIKKYGNDESIADELIRKKESGPHLRKTQCRDHPELPERADLRLYLCWDESYETDKEDFVVEQLLKCAQKDTHGRGRSREKKSHKSSKTGKTGKDNGKGKKKRKRSTSSSSSDNKSSSSSSGSKGSKSSQSARSSSAARDSSKATKATKATKAPKKGKKSKDRKAKKTKKSKKDSSEPKLTKEEIRRLEKQKQKDFEKDQRKKAKDEEKEEKKKQKEEEKSKKKAEKEEKQQVEKNKQKVRATARKALNQLQSAIQEVAKREIKVAAMPAGFKEAAQAVLDTQKAPLKDARAALQKVIDSDQVSMMPTHVTEAEDVVRQFKSLKDAGQLG